MNRGVTNFDRTTGLRSGSNGEGAIFVLTFTAIDTIVLHVCETIFIVRSQCPSVVAARQKIRHDRQGRYP